MVNSLYNPRVACFVTVRQTRRHGVVQELLEMIPVGLEHLVFGLFRMPSVQEVVPDIFTPEAARKHFFFPVQVPTAMINSFVILDTAFFWN